MDIGEIMKKAQQMQADMKKVQAELQNETFTAGVSRGAVTATVNGEMLIKEIKIDPSNAPMNDPQKLSEMIKTAVNEAIDKSKEQASKKMGRLAGGMNIPGLNGLMGG